MLGFRLFLALAVVFAGLEVKAGDYIVSSGKLSDQLFYKLVACGATPGQSCKRALLHWPKKRVNIAIVDIENGLSQKKRLTAEQSLLNAINQINSVGSDIRLVRSTAENADIKVFLAAGSRIRNHPIVRSMPKPPSRPSAGIARVFFENGNIVEALVVIAAKRGPTEVRSVMLEEVVQSLGLVNDIRNRNYRHSIFSESGSNTVNLKGQDAQALRLHYSPV